MHRLQLWASFSSVSWVCTGVHDQDPLETPNCFINWGTSGPWRAGVMPTCKLCDSKGHAKKLPQRPVQAVMMMKPWTGVTALELTPIVHHSPMWSLCRHEEEWFLINSCLLSKKKLQRKSVKSNCLLSRRCLRHSKTSAWICDRYPLSQHSISCQATKQGDFGGNK